MTGLPQACYKVQGSTSAHSFPSLLPLLDGRGPLERGGQLGLKTKRLREPVPLCCKSCILPSRVGFESVHTHTTTLPLEVRLLVYPLRPQHPQHRWLWSLALMLAVSKAPGAFYARRAEHVNALPLFHAVCGLIAPLVLFLRFS